MFTVAYMRVFDEGRYPFECRILHFPPSHGALKGPQYEREGTFDRFMKYEKLLRSPHRIPMPQEYWEERGAGLKIKAFVRARCARMSPPGVGGVKRKAVETRRKCFASKSAKKSDPTIGAIKGK